MSAPRDIEVWRGNDAVQCDWPMPAGFDPAFSSAEVTIWHGSACIITALQGEGLISDATGRKFTLDLSLEQTRLVPLGRLARYELEISGQGREQTIFCGAVIGKGGDNHDGPRPVPNGSLDFSNPGNTGLMMMGWI